MCNSLEFISLILYEKIWVDFLSKVSQEVLASDRVSNKSILFITNTTLNLCASMVSQAVSTDKLSVTGLK